MSKAENGPVFPLDDPEEEVSIVKQCLAEVRFFSRRASVARSRF